MGACCSSGLDEAAEILIDKIEDHIDTQTKLQFKISVDKIEEFTDNQPTAPTAFKMDIVNEEKQPNRLERVTDPPLPLVFPENDEDWPSAGFLEALGIHFLNDGFDLIDENKPFPDDKEQRNKIVKTFLDVRLSKIYANFRNAEAGLDKIDLTSDYGVSLMAFGGAGSQYVRGIDVANDDKSISESLPDTAFISDVTFLGKYPVRDGFEIYGASAYFNNKYELIGIYLCAFNKIFKPTDGTEWEHAKWNWRVTMVAQVTFYDHLLKCHMVEAQSLVIPTRECLPFNHPLRRFLKPHCFRTIYINNKTLLNLAGEDQLINRVFTFDYKNEIKALIDLYSDKYKFEYLPDQFKNRGMENVPDEIYPIQTEINEFWVIVHKYVTAYIGLYYYNDDALNNDEYIPLWWNELVGQSIKRKDLTLCIENIINVLTQFICNGTIWHQFAGNAQEYLKYPDWSGTKIRPNATRADIQSYVQAMTIGILTGVPMPDLMNNWSFVLLDDDNRPKALEAMNEFQLELAEMSKRVQERNKNRRMPFTFGDPRVMDVSLGI